jgi:hypothetical protein
MILRKINKNMLKFHKKLPSESLSLFSSLGAYAAEVDQQKRVISAT